jgi:heme-degrading monooxygenase HmoA
MSHLRLWRFEVSQNQRDRFVAAYRSDGDWAKLFGSSPGFLRTELWADGSGAFVTADYWRSADHFDQFLVTMGEEYRRLDSELEGIASVETFLGAFDFAG